MLCLTRQTCSGKYNFPMTQEAHELLQKTLALPENERAELAGTLISSLDAVIILMWTPHGSKRSCAVCMRFNRAR
jgi:hypothetical protein